MSILTWLISSSGLYHDNGNRFRRAGRWAFRDERKSSFRVFGFHTRILTILVDESLRKSPVGLLRHDGVRHGARSDGCIEWSPHVCYFFFHPVIWCPTNFLRLAKIRKVGLGNSNNSRARRRPWLPLPLRHRTPDGWS